MRRVTVRQWRRLMTVNLLQKNMIYLFLNEDMSLREGGDEEVTSCLMSSSVTDGSTLGWVCARASQSQRNAKLRTDGGRTTSEAAAQNWIQFAASCGRDGGGGTELKDTVGRLNLRTWQQILHFPECTSSLWHMMELMENSWMITEKLQKNIGL